MIVSLYSSVLELTKQVAHYHAKCACEKMERNIFPYQQLSFKHLFYKLGQLFETHSSWVFWGEKNNGQNIAEQMHDIQWCVNCYKEL